jgi:hypothetical protein
LSSCICACIGVSVGFVQPSSAILFTSTLTATLYVPFIALLAFANFYSRNERTSRAARPKPHNDWVDASTFTAMDGDDWSICSTA